MAEPGSSQLSERIEKDGTRIACLTRGRDDAVVAVSPIVTSRKRAGQLSWRPGNSGAGNREPANGNGRVEEKEGQVKLGLCPRCLWVREGESV